MPDTIPPELKQFVEQELASGKYHSLDEVIADGLRLLRERKLHELRREIDVGLGELERGEGIKVEGDEGLFAFFEDIKSRGQQRLEAKQRGK
jgi:antitoxin ParD1/3/4